MIARATIVARRFLSERAFTLIVEPAIADFEFTSSPRRAADYLAIVRALVGAFWEDATADSGVLTFLGLVLLPAAYYSVFFLMWQPVGFRVLMNNRVAIAFAVVVLVASVIPVAVCYWPEKINRES